jgi:putative sigma-54 modulation protein
MDILISGRGLEVTEDIRDYIEKKVDKLGRYMNNIGDIRIDLAEVKASNAADRHIAQLTVRNERGKLLRAEERSGDILAAVDAAIDKMYRQIDRYKGRGKRRRRGKARDVAEELFEVEEELDLDFETGPVVRRKRFAMTPMTEGEAIEQLELLDHDFFVYYDADAASVNVVYRRKDGGYGILEPELS